MAAIIASGTTQAASSDIAVAAGTPTTVFINHAGGELPTKDMTAIVQIKGAGGAYMTVGQLDREVPALVIDGPGTYRVLRLVTPTAFAVDQD